MERTLENVHAELLVLAQRFHTFCVENGIRYSIHGGTMLGAVRNGGFIPWDDDMDVTFTREEYEKFEAAFGGPGRGDTVLSGNGLHPMLLMKREGRPIVWIDFFIYDPMTSRPLPRKIKIGMLKLYNLMFRDPAEMRFSRENNRGNPLRYALIAAVVRHGQRADKKSCWRGQRRS